MSSDKVENKTDLVDNDFVVIDGNSLTPEQLYSIGYNQTKIVLSESALERVEEGRNVIDNILSQNRIVYGINTGFGLFSQVSIEKENLHQLQLNLIRSHSAGTGNYISLERTRMLLALRINVLSKGYSGITIETLNKLIKALNNNIISCVPEQGTVGASGDLAQLSHLALGLLGEGEVWDTSLSPIKPNDAKTILSKRNFEPLNLKAKEGLALINGTQFISCLGCEALVRAEKIARQADVVACLTLEALRGTVRAFDPKIHQARPHSGQMLSAGRFRSLLHSQNNKSQIFESHKNCGKIQDAYTLRCGPQVHGIVLDTLQFVRKILTTEINSATDNPMVFSSKWNDNMEHDDIISGGNFHGEYPAKVLDYLSIAIHEISNISERRIERLNNPMLSELPAFLIQNGGLNSGFMIAHCTAAALVSENKVLCHPSSIDSISTSASKEDHVSMGGFSARKALQIVNNVEKVVAIELLCCCQGVDLLRPLKTTIPLENVYNTVRQVVKPLIDDRYLKPDIDNAIQLLQEEKIWKAVQAYVPKEYHQLL